MTQTPVFTWGDCIRLNGCIEVLLIEDMQEHMKTHSEKPQHTVLLVEK